ncbi:EAL domain-containing protein [Anaerobacillus sp. CMMVII]|uniref:bifunctional diguanylate cyclase/phosphodiesterase n=1 Tax=Anaerobacillus sp. CMMVII TaxID=2755588 RepID=UPI0021B7C71C|nr:EAL domain-containing protein [Anaerobacillus sp. CMMVII]MCT8140021.1 EAL domain-containing protein [Anaerobacillus sp. CMMVII]
MSRHQMRYSRLAKITKLIHTNIELQEILENVVSTISEEIASCNSIGIFLLQEDGTFRWFIGKAHLDFVTNLDKHIINPVTDMLAKEAIEANQTLNIRNAMKDKRIDSTFVENFQINSLLVSPISLGEELYGLIYVMNHEVGKAMTKQEVQLVDMYVNMAAVAILNADNLTRTENLLYEKQLLLDVTSDLALCSTMQEVLDKCFHYLSQVLNNYNIGAHILDPIAERNIKPTRLSKESDWTQEEWLEKHKDIKVDHSKDKLFQDIVKNKKAVFIPDVFADERPNHHACRTFGIKGLFRIPLVSMGEVLGIISVVNLDEVNRVYTKVEMRLAQSIVDATSLALSNLLFREKQEIMIEERTEQITLKNNELEKVVKELQRLSHEKELILNSAGEGIFGLDVEGKITFCNPAAAMMLGYENKEELIDVVYDTIFNRIKTNQVSFHQNFPAYIEKNLSGYSSDEVFFRKDGTSFAVEYAVSPIKEAEEITGYVVLFKDITVRKQLEEKIKYHAYYDSLTNLPNRVLLKDRLNQALTYAHLHQEELAVLFIDLDRFKLVNDTLGHSYGDYLLQEVASRLKRSVSKGATVSRQGGDEFTIILPTIQSKGDISEVADRILNAFSSPFDLKGNEVFIKPSIGISLFPNDGIDVDTLIKNADTAMYKSKELHGNNFQFYQESMDRINLRSVKVENALHKALDNEEFVLHYQPQINSKTNEVIGVEALIRWIHPTMGLISPADFIPVAEETGLIVPIGEWVLRNACKQIKAWHEIGFSNIVVSVNLSARQFEKQNLVEIVKEILAETNLHPKFLELELTENMIIKNTKSTLETMEKLRELGIKMSIDDFGTGYSSLGYLKNFPINTLKIDRSFVHDVAADTANAAITNTIITLAGNLSLNVIAEGVETEDQKNFLSSKGCFLMQGFMFSPPIKAEEFLAKYFIHEEEEIF